MQFFSLLENHAGRLEAFVPDKIERERQTVFFLIRRKCNSSLIASCCSEIIPATLLDVPNQALKFGVVCRLLQAFSSRQCIIEATRFELGKGQIEV